jgi:hypothetical protein
MPHAPRRATGSEVVTVRASPVVLLLLSAATLVATSCGGSASAAPPAPGEPPLSQVEAAASPAASAAIRSAAGGVIEVADATSSLAGARIDLPPGAMSADATVTIDAGDSSTLRMFPDLTIVRATASATLVKPAHVRIPYSAALMAHWNITDERQLVLYTQDDDGLWGALVASIDPVPHVVEAEVDRLTSWVIAPGWMLTAWQRRALVGDAFAPGARNVLLVHGWNSSPWDGCELELAAAMRGSYDHVLAYAYPSALDIGENADWLRKEIARRYPGVTFDIVGFSEGGLIGRAAVEPGAWNGGQTITASVRNLITIATPHLGILPDAGPSLLADLGSSEMRSGSAFLRALNDHLDTGAVRYAFIAGDGGRNRASDELVGVDSGLAQGVVTAARAATLPLVHAAPGTTGGMPCDPLVYDTIKAWVR